MHVFTQVKGQEIISQEVMAFMGRATNNIKVCNSY